VSLKPFVASVCDIIETLAVEVGAEVTVNVIASMPPSVSAFGETKLNVAAGTESCVLAVVVTRTGVTATEVAAALAAFAAGAATRASPDAPIAATATSAILRLRVFNMCFLSENVAKERIPFTAGVVWEYS
jgi:phage tail sheath gpL-like